MSAGSFDAQRAQINARKSGSIAAMLAAMALALPFRSYKPRPEPMQVYDANGKRRPRDANLNIGRISPRWHFVAMPERIGKRHNRRWRHKMATAAN